MFLYPVDFEVRFFTEMNNAGGPVDVWCIEQFAGCAGNGRPFTRDALAARLRAAGYAVLTSLLAALRAEPAPMT